MARQFLLEGIHPIPAPRASTSRRTSTRGTGRGSSASRLLPDGDLFEGDQEGKASVVTDQIETFTRDGDPARPRASELDADIIITATGFDLSVLGDIAFTVDDQPLDWADTVTYRGHDVHRRAQPGVGVRLLPSELDAARRPRRRLRLPAAPPHGGDRREPGHAALRPEDVDMPLSAVGRAGELQPGLPHARPAPACRSRAIGTRGDTRRTTGPRRTSSPAADLDDGSLVYTSPPKGCEPPAGRLPRWRRRSRTGSSSVHIDLPTDQLVLVGAALLVLGVVGSGLAERIRVPGLILSLFVVGMVLGDDGLNWISLSDARLAQGLAVIALVVILYEGGLGTSYRDVRPILAPALSLATLGVAVTAAVVAGASTVILSVDRTTALLIGAVVASTDAAAVFSVLRHVPLPDASATSWRPSPRQRSHGGPPDGGRAGDLGGPRLRDHRAVFGVRQLGGLAVGLAVGWLGSLPAHPPPADERVAHPVLGFGLGGLAYGAAAALHMSGFLAVYVAGMVLAARRARPSAGHPPRSPRRAWRRWRRSGSSCCSASSCFPSRLDEQALGALGAGSSSCSWLDRWRCSSRWAGWGWLEPSSCC